MFCKMFPINVTRYLLNGMVENPHVSDKSQDSFTYMYMEVVNSGMVEKPCPEKTTDFQQAN